MPEGINLDWIVGISGGVLFIILVGIFYRKWLDSSLRYRCPKCGGADYFMSTRNVTKGLGGIYGNRGGTKQFQVCRVCDEIMEGY